MALFNGLSLTPQITTGDIATVNDARDTTKPLNGALNPLGSVWRGFDANGRPQVIRYVRYNPTAGITDAVGPVFWKDNTFTVVTPTLSECVTAAANSAAGLLLNASVTDGNFIFILTYGYAAAVLVPASTVKDDSLVGGASQAFVRVASATAPTYKPMAIALTDRASNASDILMICDSF